MKLKIELPSASKLVEGLDLPTLYPALARAEVAVTTAEQRLEKVHREIANHERLIPQLIERVHRGDEQSAALSNALRELEVQKMLVQPATDAVRQAREAVTVEKKNAKIALEREIDRRFETLSRAAAEVAPVLTEIEDLAWALIKAIADSGTEPLPGLLAPTRPSWPCSPRCNAGHPDPDVKREGWRV